MDLNSRETCYFYWELEKFCFFILILSSCESKPVCRHQSTVCSFLFLYGCPSGRFCSWKSQRPTYGQYFWSLASKRPHRIRFSLGSLLIKHICALEFLWETRACLSCLSDWWPLQIVQHSFKQKKNWNFNEKLSGSHKMCCWGSPDCSARRTSLQLEKYLKFHGITGIFYHQFTWFFSNFFWNIHGQSDGLNAQYLLYVLFWSSYD